MGQVRNDNLLALLPSTRPASDDLRAGFTAPGATWWRRRDEVGYEAFAARARQGGGMVPVTRQVVLDGDTPVTAFAKLHRGPTAFCSNRWREASGGRATPSSPPIRARCSAIGAGRCARWTPGDGWSAGGADVAPLEHLGRTMRRHPPVEVPGLPRFTGGAVGYIGYDIVRTIESLPAAPPDDRDLPDAIVMVADTLLVLDNLFNRATVIATVEVRRGRR